MFSFRWQKITQVWIPLFPLLNTGGWNNNCAITKQLWCLMAGIFLKQPYYLKRSKLQGNQNALCKSPHLHISTFRPVYEGLKSWKKTTTQLPTKKNSLPASSGCEFYPWPFQGWFLWPPFGGSSWVTWKKLVVFFPRPEGAVAGFSTGTAFEESSARHGGRGALNKTDTGSAPNFFEAKKHGSSISKVFKQTVGQRYHKVIIQTKKPMIIIHIIQNKDIDELYFICYM